LADQQYKSSDTYQHRNQNTDNERNNPMPTLGRLRSSAFLRRSDTQPKEKVAHASPESRRNFRSALHLRLSVVERISAAAESNKRQQTADDRHILPTRGVQAYSITSSAATSSGV